MSKKKIEISPIYRSVLVDVYDENPYKITKTEEGLEISDEFMNSDSGQIDKKDFFLECAKVINVGPDCKFVKTGDDVMIDIRAISPLPFKGEIYWLVEEPAIRAVIGRDLN